MDPDLCTRGTWMRADAPPDLAAGQAAITFHARTRS